MPFFEHVLLIIGQAIWIVMLAPLLTGVINKVKALLQARRGPRLLQPYYDLSKYFKKDAVFSHHTSWITIATPYIVFAVTLTSGLLLPLVSQGISINGDLLLFVYLLAVGRFFTALAALDTGSSFGGMGASREMALNTIIEPAFLLAAIAVILQTGTTNFIGIVVELNEQLFFNLPYILTMFAMLLVILGETGRIPVDNLDTHLELTMIHEGMILEYSGRYLGLMMLSSMIKQLLFISIFCMFFFRVGQKGMTEWGTVFFEMGSLSIKILFIGIVVAIIEMMYAKIRLYQVPKLFVTSITLSMLAIVVNLLF